LSVELLEREGYSKALPIVFEDVYTSACAKCMSCGPTCIKCCKSYTASLLEFCAKSK